MSALKTRDFAAQVSIRARPGAPPGERGNRLAGYAAVFGAESDTLCDRNVNDGRPFIEVIDRSAFDRTLEGKPDVRMLWNHDTSLVLGRTASRTLDLKPDDLGLLFLVALPDTQAGRDCRELVRRGDVSAMSFGFVVVRDRLEDRGPGRPALRTLLEVQLHEISVVAFPAYSATSVAVRGRKSSPLRDLCAKKLRHLEMQLQIEGID